MVTTGLCCNGDYLEIHSRNGRVKQGSNFDQIPEVDGLREIVISVYSIFGPNLPH